MTTIDGLPAHALLVHAVVVHTSWPAAARRLGVVRPLLRLVVLAPVPITTNAGKHLEESLGGGALIDRHAESADQILSWTVALPVVGVGAVGARSLAAIGARRPGADRRGVGRRRRGGEVVLARAAGSQALWAGVG